MIGRQSSLNIHEHDYKGLALAPIKSKLWRKYQGTPGDRAFLVDKCDCGKVRPRDYGLTTDMEVKLKELKGAR